MRPLALRLPRTLSTAPPLILSVSGSGRTAPSSRCEAALRITAWVSLSFVMDHLRLRRAPSPSYEPEPRRADLVGAGAGDRRRYSAHSPSLKAESVSRFSSSA